MRFYLDFKSDNFGKKEIQEPFGLDAISFSLKQKEKGMARDISLTGGEAMFEFTHMRNHELKQLLYYNRKFGFESSVNLIIEIDENNKFVCELDFANSETDDLEYFRCKGIQQGVFQVLKRRNEVKVDVKSDLDIDGNFIGGLVPENMLLLAKPIVQESEWRQVTQFDDRLTASTKLTFLKGTVFSVNPCVNLLKANIDDSFTFFSPRSTGFNDFLMVTARTNLSEIDIAIKGCSALINTGTTGATSGTVNFKLVLRWGAYIEGTGTAYPDSTNKTVLFSKDLTLDSPEFSFIGNNFFYKIDKLNREDKIWLSYEFLLTPQGLSNVSMFCDARLDLTSIDISAGSTAFNSVSQSLRLVDVMRQVVKSASGLEINAPRFEVGGEFYDNRLLDGNFLRVINDKPFSVSLEDLEQSLTEMKADWEIGNDGKIFFGIEQDFYQPIESGFFDNTQFSEMNKTFNPKYKTNEFRYKYKNYQSLKENEEPNSADTIHGESRFTFFNKLVENKKDNEIEWTRDAFLIEETRRKALIIEENTASQNDDTLFCIDSIATEFDNTFTESASFNHVFNTATARLSLTNDGTVNFVSIGIQAGSVFKIESPDPNTGTYTVYSVLNNILELTGTSGGVSANGVRPTKFTYALDSDFTPFTNYTDQGFSETENLGSADSYSNRRYSIARNIYNYWRPYLATCNLYWKDRVIKNTWYKNNGDYTAKYAGVKLTEKADFIPDNPILSPVLYNDMVFANVEFEDFILLQNNIRSQRGYIRTIDNNDQVIKIYPVDMDYKLLEKELTIKGEEKYEPTSMSISTEFDYILINNETRVYSLQWEIKAQKLYIYDENRYLLYNGMYWMEVSINGAFANSIEQLESWLNLVN